jgi:hypothetical protein
MNSTQFNLSLPDGTMLSGVFLVAAGILFRFQIKDDIKAARTEATKAYR